jgi:CRP/FNR family cyclic AMP-dependent transcriptional regulator
MPMSPDAIPLLAGLTPTQRQAATITRRFAPGSVIFWQGEATTGLWIILEGRVAVERTGPDGAIYTTGVWHPGEIIGIAGLWDGSGYPASARALDDPTVLLWMARDRFLELHRTVPPFAEAVSRTLAARLRFVQETVADTRGRPAAVQLAVILATLAERAGPEITLTHEDLAHMMGAKRETVSRILSEFHQHGWVEVHYGRLTVRDPAALRHLVRHGE